MKIEYFPGCQAYSRSVQKTLKTKTMYLAATHSGERSLVAALLTLKVKWLVMNNVVLMFSPIDEKTPHE